MRAVAAALEAPHERVRLARRPHAVELGRVPRRLEGHLGYADAIVNVSKNSMSMRKGIRGEITYGWEAGHGGALLK